jgi:hypothetical protein
MMKFWAWDLLGEDFEHEAAALGLSYPCEITYPTNSSLDRKSLAQSDLNLLRTYMLKVEDHLSDRTFS